MSEPTRVTLSRLDTTLYEATNARGARIEVGGEGNCSPVELLLAAIAGCTAVDVDVMTSRRAEPEEFVVEASGRKETEGGNHLEDLTVTFYTQLLPSSTLPVRSHLRPLVQQALL